MIRKLLESQRCLNRLKIQLAENRTLQKVQAQCQAKERQKKSLLKIRQRVRKNVERRKPRLKTNWAAKRCAMPA